MTQTTKHTPFIADIYTGRDEPYEDDLARYWYQHIHAFDNQKIALVGFASDQGVNRNQGRIGAKHAPNVIKTAFGKLPISLSLQRQFDDLSVLVGDIGNIACLDEDTISQGTLESAQQSYADTISHIIKSGKIAIGLGGGHEIAFGSFVGLHQGLNQGLHTDSTLPKQRIGIINLDAHFDLRHDKYATSGTPFRQISEFLGEKDEPFYYLPIGISTFGNTASLFAKAENLGVSVISESDCHRLSFDAIAKRIDDFVAQVDCVYLTLDLDVLQAGFMPAVSAVNAFGLSMDFVERCIQHIITTGKVKLLDIAEFNPSYDIDGRGAKVAGRLLAGMVGGVLALSSSH